MATTDTLTATDRCDRCGAQAYVRITLTSGAELLFCGHHGHQHEAAIREQGAHIETTPRSGC